VLGCDQRRLTLFQNLKADVTIPLSFLAPAGGEKQQINLIPDISQIIL